MDKYGALMWILVFLLVYCNGKDLRSNERETGHGENIDNPNVPIESDLENILESEVIFKGNKDYKPKDIHPYGKAWEKAQDLDRSMDDESGESETSDVKRYKDQVERNFVESATGIASAALWPNKTVPYVVDEATYGDLTKFYNLLYPTIDMYTTETCIQWKLWNESLASELGHNHHVTFKSASGCSSCVGISSCPITLTQPGCGKLYFHEMAHAIGMKHEQSRGDRNYDMKINWQNIQEGYAAPFLENDQVTYDSLDPFSALQYNLKAFSYNGLPTIELKNPTYEFLTTMSRNYSFYDMEAINRAYKCGESCPNPPECENFGYLNKECGCRCPDGLTGIACNETAGNCGGVIELTSGESQFIESPNYPQNYDLNLTCVWLIKAPANHRIKATILDLDLAWNPDENRCYHWIEMHTNLIGEPGLKRCGKLSDLSVAEYFHTINKEANILMIKFDSAYANDRPATSGFRLQVLAQRSGCLGMPCKMGSTCFEGANDYTYTCICLPGFTGDHCDFVTAESTVTCDFEEDFGDNCPLVPISDGWFIDDKYGDITSSHGGVFARIKEGTPTLVSDVTFEGAERCLTFDYINFGGESSGGLTVSYENGTGTKTQLFQTFTDDGANWQKVTADLPNISDMKIVVEGSFKWVRKTAIDHFMFIPGKCDEPCVLHNPCLNNGVCIPNLGNNSFTCQCTNGYVGDLCETPTNTTTFRCTFEFDSPCILTQLTADDTDWTIHAGTTKTFYTGPDAAFEGVFYSYIEATGHPNGTAVYSSGILPDTNRCMMFDYHLRGTDIGQLTVKTIDSNGLENVVWTDIGDKKNFWFKAKIDIPSAPGLDIMLEGEVGAGERSDVAIDDVFLRPGVCGCDLDPCRNGATCIDAADYSSFTCLCKDGYAGELCNIIGTGNLTCDLESEYSCFLTQDTTDDMDFSRHSGATPTLSTGPSAAFGGSYYYYMEGTGRSQGEKAKLYTSDQFTNAERCLKFSYHMYGSKMGTLNIKTETTTLFTKSGNQGNQWYSEVIPIPAQDNFKLIFEGIIGPGWKSDLALDEIQLKKGACGCDSSPCLNDGTCIPSNDPSISYTCNCTPVFGGSICNQVGAAILSCTLEDGNACFLMQDQSDDRDWIRTNAATPSVSTGPSAAAVGSYYYYIEGGGTFNGAIARLKSTDTFQDMDRCLYLQYHMYGSGIGSLKVKANDVEVFSRSGNLGDSWSQPVAIPMPYQLNSLVIEGIRGPTGKSDIGIDDIYLRPESCPATKREYSSSDGKTNEERLLEEIETLLN